MSGTLPIKVKKIVVVGDGTVGKTCLLHSFTEDIFLDQYIPTIYEKQEFEIRLDGQDHMIKLYDTAGQEEYDQLRKTIYREADAFLVCYSVDSRTSFQNVKEYWVKEVRQVMGNVPMVLCATKLDLRGIKPNCVTTQEGEDLARQINANTFLECSAKDNIRVKETVYEAIRASVAGSPPRPIDYSDNSRMDNCCDKCSIM